MVAKGRLNRIRSQQAHRGDGGDQTAGGQVAFHLQTVEVVVVSISKSVLCCNFHLFQRLPPADTRGTECIPPAAVTDPSHRTSP